MPTRLRASPQFLLNSLRGLLQTRGVGSPDGVREAVPTGLHVAVLGPLEVLADGAPVDLGPRKQRAVLGVLAALAPAAVPVARLVDEVWGDAGPADPLRSLQVYVSSLRSALGEYGDRVVTVDRAYRLSVEAAEIDAVRFGDLAAAAAVEPDAEAAVALVDEALALWRGEAWQDLRDLPVTTPLVVALEAERAAAQAVRARALLALGRHRELVPWLEPLLEQRPLDEELRGHLMLALHRSDRQADALAVCAAGRQIKADQTGLDLGEDLQQLQAAILADDPALRVEDVELRSRRHLPAQLTGLVGRESEVAGLVALLREPGRRLVTLVGPGGIGKTRVALEVAHRLAADHPDGVWFVALDALRDHRLVARAIADAVGVDEVAGDVVVPLRQHLSARQLLLVLDNFEHVDDAAPLVGDLLAAAPGLRVLVTSRVALRLYGEHVRTLEPLAIGDAVPLFLERARQVEQHFDAPEPAIADLCEHLDRMPLALELVAARVDEVPVDAMLAQLRDRRALDLAVRGPRDRSARQQTLRDAIGWSVSLLPGDLARRFARLGVFAGGFDGAGAAEVAGATAADIVALARASLVERAGGDRYRLLETVREYAVEQLGDERDAAADAHAQWFHDLAVESVAGMRGPETRAWIARFDGERANFRVALDRLAATARQDHPVGTRVLRAAASLGLYWYRSGAGSEDTEWLPRALALAPDADPALRGRAEYAFAICLGEQGHAAEALAHSRAARDLLRDEPDPTWSARVLNTLAGLTRDIGHAEEAAVLMDEAIALRRTLADGSLGITVALANRAMIALDLRDVATARACLDECLRTEEDELEVAMTHAGLADVELEAGDLDAAAERLRAAIDVLVDRGQEFRLVECLDSLAALAVQRDEPALAATLVAAADQGLAEEGAVLVPADAALRRRRVGHALSGLDPEKRSVAEERGRALGLVAAVALARDRLLTQIS